MLDNPYRAPRSPLANPKSAAMSDVPPRSWAWLRWVPSTWCDLLALTLLTMSGLYWYHLVPSLVVFPVASEHKRLQTLTLCGVALAWLVMAGLGFDAARDWGGRRWRHAILKTGVITAVIPLSILFITSLGDWLAGFR